MNFIGILYYQVGNLSPYLRSKLRSIQVVAVTKVPFITTYGIDPVLEPFINDMKKLEQVRLVIIFVIIFVSSVCTYINIAYKVCYVRFKGYIYI